MFNNKLFIVAIVVAAFVIVGCTPNEPTTRDNEDHSSTTGGTTGSTTGNTPTNPETPANCNVVSINMTARDFSYSPNTIQAAPGDTVSISFNVTGGMHDFVIDELNVRSATVTQGNTRTIEFVVPESAAGQSFTFYCSIGNHRAFGMEGTLTVSQS